MRRDEEEVEHLVRAAVSRVCLFSANREIGAALTVAIDNRRFARLLGDIER